MEETKTLSREQVVCMTFAAACGNIVYTFTWVTNVTGRPFWIAVLLGVLSNIPLAVWTFYLGKYRKGGTIFDILEMGFGKIVSGIIIIFFIIINSAAAACMLNMFTGALRVFFLRTTPSWVIMLIIVFMSTIFVNSEIKTIGRMIEIMVVLYVVNFFTGFSLSFIKEFRLDNIVPVLDTTVYQFAKGTLITTGITSECILFLMTAVGSTPDPYKHYNWAVKGLVYWSLILSLAIFIMAGDISPELLSRVAQAGITVSKVIQIGEFFRGMEVLILITYQLIAISKIVLYLYSSWISSKKLFGSKRPMLQLIFTAIFVYLPSVWINSYNTGYFFSIFLGVYIIFPFVIFVLLLAAFSILIQRRKAGNIEK